MADSAKLKLSNKYLAVSLGFNCIPRWLLTRNNLKYSKAEGELSMPFDLAGHLAPEVTKFLKNKFKDYFDNFIYDKDRKIWIQGENRIQLLHDLDIEENNRDFLVSRYSARIKNFWKVMKSNKPILFLQSLQLEEDVDNLYDILKKIRKNKPFELVIFDLENLVNTKNKNINVLKIPFPEKDYVWYEEKYFNSPQGIEFEKKMVDYCKKIIIEKLLS